MNIASARLFSSGFSKFLWPTPAVRPEGQAGTRGVFTTWQRCALLGAFVLLVMFRLPAAWAHGRFQAEEGTVFFAYAWHFPWWDALFRPFGGYLNLGANAPAVLTVGLVRSGLLPLERAPYLTMAIALVFQLLPALLILTGNARWLESRRAVVAALLVVAIAPSTEEVFFNTPHIQFHLALCVALILSFEVPATRIVRAAYGVILFLAPLCGPSSVVLLPLFALRALVDRQRGRWIQSGILAAGAALQLAFFYSPTPFRPALDGRTIFAALFVRLFLLPFAGIASTNWAARGIWASPLLFSAAAVASVLLFALLALMAVRRRQGTVWLVFAAFLIAAVSTRFGIFSADRRNMLDVTIGERYLFVPLVLLCLSLIAMAVQTAPRQKLVWTVLGLVVLLNGALAYAKPAQQWTHGANWVAEVRQWKANHDYPLAAWPDKWLVDLSDRPQTCSPARAAAPNDRSYCESGWSAALYR